MQPWIIEELWRWEEEDRQRQQEWHREQIHIDAPNGELAEDEFPGSEPQRGVLIIEL